MMEPLLQKVKRIHADPEIQKGECKNSLTPLAGKASSMPGGFYWDAIALMVLAGVGLIS